MPEIPLKTKSGFTVAFAEVDAEDYERVSRHVWKQNGEGQAVLAGRKHVGENYLQRWILDTPWPIEKLDGDRNNYRRANLRACTHVLPRVRSDPAAPPIEFRGVSWYGARARADAQLPDVCVQLGVYVSLRAASIAYELFRCLTDPEWEPQWPDVRGIDKRELDKAIERAKREAARFVPR